MANRPQTTLIDVKVEEMRRILALVDAQQGVIRAYYRAHGHIADRSIELDLEQAVTEVSTTWSYYCGEIFRLQTGLVATRLQRRHWFGRVKRSYAGFRTMGLSRVPAIKSALLMSRAK